jgi:hypothetical protein
MSTPLIALAFLLAFPLTLTTTVSEPDPVSAPALAPDDRERLADWSALMAERFAPGPTHGTTDDHDVRRALSVAADRRR